MFQIDKRLQKPKIWMYRDKASGRSKGECTVTFENPCTATCAVSWCDGKEFMGKVIKVSIAERPKTEFERTGQMPGGGGGGFRGGRGRGGDRGEYMQ